jgi:hypothetical protein
MTQQEEGAVSILARVLDNPLTRFFLAKDQDDRYLPYRYRVGWILVALVPLGLGVGLWWFLSSNNVPSGGPQAIVLGIVALACLRKAINGPPES